MDISVDNLQDDAVLVLLEEHLSDMRATSPPESVHALDVDALKGSQITFWCARDHGKPLGCIALKELTPSSAEIKSMRTNASSRGQGVATALLKHLIAEARHRGYESLHLETGSQDFFKPACRLYQAFGFEFCKPFGGYIEDPNSLFMSLKLI